jgi:electron transfer flavoprotein beta subunit
MRIVVCVKQIYDPATVKISRSREDLDLRQAVKKSNPLDRYALEAALRLRESTGGKVTALSAGEPEAEVAVREAVAMGADHGVLLSSREFAAAGDAGIVRAIVSALSRLGSVDLLLTGQVDPFGGSGSLAARLAGALGWPVVLDADCVTAADDSSVQAIVPDARGAFTVALACPAVIAVAPGTSRPRWPSAQRIANAYRPGLVDVWSAADLGLDADSLAPDTEPGGLLLGPERTRGQYLSANPEEAATALLEVLHGKRVI